MPIRSTCEKTAIFQVLTAMLLEMQVLWNITLWRLVNYYRGREHLQCQVGQEEDKSMNKNP